MIQNLIPLVTIFALSVQLISAMEIKDVNEAEEKTWIRNVIPLPHEINISAKAILNPGEIKITIAGNPDNVVKNAGKELHDFLADIVSSDSENAAFEIVLGMLGNGNKVNGIQVENADRLRKLPYSDQAYIIQPIGKDKLVLTGLSEKGVYYAQVTLQRLLKTTSNRDRAEIPLADVVDWPDTEERGLWNCGTLSMNLAPTYKFNYCLANVYIEKVKRDKPLHATVRTNQLAKGRLTAVNVVPRITHLNFLDSRDLYSEYPELLGKGKEACAGQYHAHKRKNTREEENRAPCASNPLLTKILAQWMTDVALAGVRECGCWLTERPAQCECKNCMADGQFVWEARAFVNAWKQVAAKYPDFTIRLFISTTTNEKYEQVLKELPPGVKVERACALGLERQHKQPRDIFVNERMDPHAAEGLWVATYDIPVTANGKVDTPEINLPHSSPQRIRNFIHQMAARKYSGMYGMLDGGVAPEMNVAAIAEWTWNINGRSVADFAEAWAVQNGYDQPENVARWVELMGPVEWDVYDSGFPECYAWGEAANMVRKKIKPVLGKGMFRYYPTPESFDKKIGTCNRALALARKMNKPDLANETEVVLSYVQMAKYIYLIANAVSSDRSTQENTGPDTKTCLAELARAGKANVDAIRKWRLAIGPEKTWHRRTRHAIQFTEDTVREITEATGS